LAESKKYNSYGKIAEADKGTVTTASEQSGSRKALASWVVQKVQDWEQYRDQNYKERWIEYYRLWRGLWTHEDKTRDSERSRLISPALQQAVEAAVAEQEEATFGKEAWFDISDDILDGEKEDMARVRESLLEDFDKYGIPEAVSEIYLNAALYGTGIGKLVVESVPDRQIASLPGKNGEVIDGIIEGKEIAIKLEPIAPENFVIDSNVNKSGREGIEQALGCACVMIVPRHTVEAKQRDAYEDVPATYYSGDFGSLNTSDGNGAKGEPSNNSDDRTRLVEYYGKVPRKLLELAEKDSNEELTSDEIDETDLVEAYVSVANDMFLLRAYENPNIMKDRPIVAYAFDVVPNRFWGRGIAEKAYNPQKALDGILRAQMDGLALTVHPMMAADATRIPRGTQLTVKPGKFLLTNGNPGEVLKEFRFGSIDPMSYNATGDLERMIQMATGAMDSASPLRSNRRNETASGMSMIMGGSLKRSKRILQGIERNFLLPLIYKSLYRYMQFKPDRYPAGDYKFRVRGTLGMMAREVEQSQLTNLLQFVPPETPAFFVLLKGIIEASSVENKDQIQAVIDQMLQPQEPDPREEAAVQMEFQREALEQEEIQSRIDHRKAKIGEGYANTRLKTLQALKGESSKTKK